MRPASSVVTRSHWFITSTSAHSTCSIISSNTGRAPLGIDRCTFGLSVFAISAAMAATSITLTNADSVEKSPSVRPNGFFRVNRYVIPRGSATPVVSIKMCS